MNKKTFDAIQATDNFKKAVELLAVDEIKKYLEFKMQNGATLEELPAHVNNPKNKKMLLEKTLKKYSSIRYGDTARVNARLHLESKIDLLINKTLKSFIIEKQAESTAPAEIEKSYTNEDWRLVRWQAIKLALWLIALYFTFKVFIFILNYEY